MKAIYLKPIDLFEYIFWMKSFFHLNYLVLGGGYALIRITLFPFIFKTIFLRRNRRGKKNRSITLEFLKMEGGALFDLKSFIPRSNSRNK